jgi:hypothetical protein
VWSSIWADRLDLRVVFDIEPAIGGSSVTCTLLSPQVFEMTMCSSAVTASTNSSNGQLQNILFDN